MIISPLFSRLNFNRDLSATTDTRLGPFTFFASLLRISSRRIAACFATEYRRPRLYCIVAESRVHVTVWWSIISIYSIHNRNYVERIDFEMLIFVFRSFIQMYYEVNAKYKILCKYYT